MPRSASQRAVAFSRIASNTGLRSPADRLMMRSTSAVAASCARAALSELLATSNSSANPFISSFRPVTPAAGGFYDEDIANAHLRLVRVGQCGPRPIRALDPVAAHLAGLSARHPVGRNSPMSG